MDEQSTMYVIKYFNTGNLKEEVNWWLDGTLGDDCPCTHKNRLPRLSKGLVERASSTKVLCSIPAESRVGLFLSFSIMTIFCHTHPPMDTKHNLRAHHPPTHTLTSQPSLNIAKHWAPLKPYIIHTHKLTSRPYSE